MSALPIPTVSEVARIAALSDPVLRNLQITFCYHQLARVMPERTGWEANWCTFATWASKQAGQTIRKEDLARALEGFLDDNAEREKQTDHFLADVRRLGVKVERRKFIDLMWKAVDADGAFARSSDAVARGNLKVFAEIGHEFARFYASCFADEQYEGENIAKFIGDLRPGPPPEGQEHLRQAFQGYYQALFETDPKVRSELLLLSNLQIGFHEQTRLQPEINEALVAPVIMPQEFIRNLVRAYYPQNPRKANAVLLVLRGLGRLVGFDAFVKKYIAGVQQQAQFLVTHLMMTLDLPPHTRLRLGDDLSASFPPLLKRITNSSLLALLAQIDPTPDSPSGSGADYWGDLPDRLHFIADLFRCYHASVGLFAAPFSPEQINALKNGHLPSAPL
jgi:hypothetical protein